MRFQSMIGRLLACAGFMAGSWAGTAAQTITGEVIAAADQTVVEGAEVALLTPDSMSVASAVTSSWGRFAIAAPAPGEYLVRVVRLGFSDLTIGPVSLAEAQTMQVQIRLEVRAIALEPMTVVASIRGIQQRDLWEYHQRLGRYEHYVGTTIFPRAELAEHDAWTYEEFVRRMAPRIATPGGGCAPVVFLNGERVMPDPLQSLERIEGIEFHRGMGPSGSLFVNEDGCGVILVWTRTYFEENGRG